MFKRNTLKKYAVSVLAVLVIASFITFIPFIPTAHAAIQSTYYLSPTGSDSNNGTSLTTAFKTIEKAQSVVRTINGNMTGDIIVYLRGGTYTANNTISFGVNDSGTNGYNVKYLAYPGEKPVIEGGQALTGTWSLYDSSKGIYALTGVTSDFRQLYVNGQKAIRARSPNTGSYYRMISADLTNYTVTINSAEISNWNNFSQVEMHAMLAWSESILRLSSYTVSGSQAVLKFQTPESNIVFPRPYPSIGSLGGVQNHVYYFENAYELLDSEGEWYLNKATQTLYYKPRAGENMSTAAVVAPKLETIVSITGTLAAPVHNIWFSGITFQHSTYMRPSQFGFVDAQAFQYNISSTTDNKQYVGRPSAGVYAAAANNLRFERNTFTQMGATALDFNYGTHDDMIVGNVFADISGTAIAVGKFTQDESTEFHVPYNPTDTREICTNETIQNNYIHDIGIDYQGAVGIGAGYPKGILISHNELFNMPYSGISVGFGWTSQNNAMSNNSIVYNDIHHVVQLLADGAAIYTLSKQPNSTVAYNYVHDFSKASTADYSIGSMYFDEGTGGYSIHDNVRINVPRILFNGTASSNTQSNNDGTDPTIISNAGIEAAYQDIKGANSNIIVRSGWTATASNTKSGFPASNGIDTDPNSRWTSGKNQDVGDWYQVDMGQSNVVSRVQFSGNQNVNGDFPGACDIFVSADGVNWGTAVASVTANVNLTIDKTFVAKSGRYIKIVITQAKTAWWDIRDFNAFKS